jgi:hypothetical protein
MVSESPSHGCNNPHSRKIGEVLSIGKAWVVDEGVNDFFWSCSDDRLYSLKVSFGFWQRVVVPADCSI